MSKIEDYASQIPIEIKKAVKALGNDIRCAIVVDLIHEGELTFTQLKNDLDIEPGLLSNHLKILMDGAIVEHYYRHEFGNEQFSYYGLTFFGRDFIRGILEPLKAIQPSGKLPATSTSSKPVMYEYPITHGSAPTLFPSSKQKRLIKRAKA